ncbi:MAG: hypothetical protein A3A51_02465 [Candidatus Levybacteria bacterium RIFCSPLOWO2_01_FULL_39_10]|nr:MAG: hypothetical protein A3A51_02465 [Candidatus Levybacteria bacterium RIFCSPLOWO2_01_FULL_39_10]
MKKLSALIFFFAIFLFIAKGTFAQNTNFSTTYKVNYQVSADESTKVILEIELKNKTSNYFASSYEILTGFENIRSINAQDTKGPLSYEVSKENGSSLIKFDFNENAVGLGNSQKFRIEFVTDGIADHLGNIWEVNIPGVSDQASYDVFEAIVTVPQEFGEPSFIKPATNAKVSGNTLRFTKSDLGNSGISISYGDGQIYDFDLLYHLENLHIFPITREIALPSNNNYQEVRINQIIPRPIDVKIDEDGNWIAKYRLGPSEEYDVRVQGSAKVSHIPKKEVISDQQRNKYLKTDEYWETQNPEIVKLAKKLKTPENIYNFLVDNLTYDEKRVGETQIRAGAANALRDPKSAVCLEFTDLFVALARAAGIPSRAVEGYANTTNIAQRPLSAYKDVLHAWPQFYDFEKQSWIMVDPTWGNTTGGIDYFNVLDFDHFAFVVKGVDSDYPIPAGGYKSEENINDQDVNVSVGTVFEKKNPKLSAYFDFQEKYIAGIPIGGTLIVVNDSEVLSPNQSIGITSDSLTPQTQDLFLDKIPPFGKKEVQIKFAPQSFLTNRSDTIKITIGNETIDREIVIIPFYKSNYFYIFLGVILIGSTAGALFIFARRTGRLHLPRRR